jgi:hypothetical protein
MASPVIDYTNLLHAKKSLTDPEVEQFKQSHSSDHEFVQQSAVVEWAFKARSIPKEDQQHVKAGQDELVPM